MRHAEPEELTSLDRHFAGLLVRLAGKVDPALERAAALVSCRTGQGHVCVDLAELAGRSVPGADGESVDVLYPPLAEWKAVLAKSGVVAGPGGRAPLMLDGDRLYLHRYWEYEQLLAADLCRRAQASVRPVETSGLRAALERLFPGTPAADRQKRAAAVAALKQLCIISGGPGTGKTTTVVKILALLQDRAPAPLRIGLAAPTGKAAGRLQESIRGAKQHLDLPAELLARIPEQAATIHRLLGAAGGAGLRPRSHQSLPLDVLVVDEASMADLALAARLVAALPAEAKLLLLGDKDQLASVEAGAVLGDICGTGAGGSFSAEFGKALTALGLSGWTESEEPVPAPLTDCLVLLERNYRFQKASGIGRLARAINRGDARESLAALADGSGAGLRWQEWTDAEALGQLAVLVRQGYGPYLRARSPEEAFASFNRFRLLCAHRHGPQGVEVVNRWVEKLLAEEGLRPAGQLWYPGRPVLMTRNDYRLELYNGDLGLTLPDGRGRLRVYFPQPGGGLRAVSPVRLSGCETGFALTVHKSQGSEFESVALLLPQRSSPVVCRELLYTAATRARAKLAIWGSRDLLEQAVATRLHRSTGLRELLWGQ